MEAVYFAVKQSILTCVILCAFASTPSLAGQAPLVLGELISSNDVMVSSSGIETELNDQDNFIIFSGDVVTAGADSVAEIRIAELGTLTVAPDSVVSISLAQGVYTVAIERGGLSSYSLMENAPFRIVAADNELVGVSDPADSASDKIGGAMVLDQNRHLYVAGVSGDMAITNGDGELGKIPAGSLAYTGPASMADGPLFAQVASSPPDAVSAEREGNDCLDDSEPDDDCPGIVALWPGGGTAASGVITTGSAALIPAGIFLTGGVAALVTGGSSGGGTDDTVAASPAQ